MKLLKKIGKRSGNFSVVRVSASGNDRADPDRDFLDTGIEPDFCIAISAITNRDWQLCL
jgi:hypothetical protein